MHQLKRVTPSTIGQALDQYFTKPDVVRRCLSQLEDIHSYDLLVEPSAGAGAFLFSIVHPNKTGIDVDPKHSDILKDDFLNYCIDPKYKKVLVLGNPPYGRYHHLSKAFILHAMSFPNVKTIGFVLPNVYRKHTPQRRSSADIITGTKDFLFANRHDFDVFVFGTSPKRVIRDPKPNNRGYFLKSLIPIDLLVNRIQSIDWQGNSCASGGVYWLTKYEFWHQYKSCYE